MKITISFSTLELGLLSDLLICKVVEKSSLFTVIRTCLDFVGEKNRVG